jgi:hypothetical protein
MDQNLLGISFESNAIDRSRAKGAAMRHIHLQPFATDRTIGNRCQDV